MKVEPWEGEEVEHPHGAVDANEITAKYIENDTIPPAFTIGET